MLLITSSKKPILGDGVRRPEPMMFLIDDLAGAVAGDAFEEQVDDNGDKTEEGSFDRRVFKFFSGLRVSTLLHKLKPVPACFLPLYTIPHSTANVLL